MYQGVEILIDVKVKKCEIMHLIDPFDDGSSSSGEPVTYMSISSRSSSPQLSFRVKLRVALFFCQLIVQWIDLNTVKSPTDYFPQG